MAETRANLPLGSIGLIPLLETARSMQLCYEIAQIPRVTGIVGAVIASPLLNAMRVTDKRARGFSLGLAAHGVRAVAQHGVIGNHPVIRIRSGIHVRTSSPPRNRLSICVNSCGKSLAASVSQRSSAAR